MDGKDKNKQNTDIDFDNYRTESFIASIVFLVLTVLSFVLFSLFFSLLNFDLNNVDSENAGLPGGSVIAIIFAGAAFAFLGGITVAVAFVLSLIGFCLGYSSIKHLPTKRMSFWAKIISFVHLGILIITGFVGVQAFLF